MKTTKRDFIIIIPYLILVIIGLHGSYYIPYISPEQTFEFVKKYLFIPVVILSLFYAYLSTFGYKQQVKIALWRNLLGFVVTTIVIGMVTFVSFQGLSIIINKEFGLQSNYLLSGKIVRLHYPANKKIGNKYSIFIQRDIERDTIEINVSTNKYSTGQEFRKEMKVGLFGFLYSER